MGLNKEQARKILGRDVPEPTLSPQLAAVFGSKPGQPKAVAVVHTLGKAGPVEEVPRVRPHWEKDGEDAPKPKVKKRKLEWAEQVNLVNALLSAGLMFSGSLNGVPLPVGVARMAKASGMVRGDADITIWTHPPAHPGAPGMMVELKLPSAEPVTERAGQFSGARPHQKDRLGQFQALGWHVVIGYGCADALCKIRAAGYDLSMLPACLFVKTGQP
jgi:hypothetical protein